MNLATAARVSSPLKCTLQLDAIRWLIGWRRIVGARPRGNLASSISSRLLGLGPCPRLAVRIIRIRVVLADV